MGQVVHKRRPIDIVEEQVKPIYLSPTTTNRFQVPETLYSDLEEAYNTDHPNHKTAKLITNWYEYDEEQDTGYIPFRAGQFQIQWKSAIGNADMKTMFRVARKLGIKPRRGDIVLIEGNSVPHLVDWHTQEGPNDYNTQLLELNTWFTFKRFQPEVTDEDGYLIHEEGKSIIIPKIPGNASEYAGRPDFDVILGTPGITSVNLMTCYIQYNPITAQLRIGDEFILGDYTYHVENISYERVNIDKQHGELMFHGRRSPGGGVGG